MSDMSLKQQVLEAVSIWLERRAPEIKDMLDYATLEITISNAQAEEDGTLYLDCRLEEKSKLSDIGGTIPGLKLWDDDKEDKTDG